jgi:hypothetical protein
MLSQSTPPQAQEDTALVRPPVSNGRSPERGNFYAPGPLDIATASGSRFFKLFPKRAENGAKTNDGSDKGRTLGNDRSSGARAGGNDRGSNRWDPRFCPRSVGHDRKSSDSHAAAGRSSPPVECAPGSNTSPSRLTSYELPETFPTDPHAEGARARAGGLTADENPYLWPPGAREAWAAGWSGSAE